MRMIELSKGFDNSTAQFLTGIPIGRNKMARTVKGNTFHCGGIRGVRDYSVLTDTNHNHKKLIELVVSPRLRTEDPQSEQKGL